MEDWKQNIDQLFARAKSEKVEFPIANVAAIIGGAASVTSLSAATGTKIATSTLFNSFNTIIMIGSAITITTVALLLNLNTDKQSAETTSEPIQPSTTNALIKELNLNQSEPLSTTLMADNPKLVELLAENGIEIPAEDSVILANLIEETTLVNVVDEEIPEPPVPSSNLLAFTTISLNMSANITLEKGNSHKASFNGDQAVEDLVDLKVAENVLYISLKPGKEREYQRLMQNGDFNLVITLPNIEAILVNGSGSVYSEDVFPAEKLKIQINGSGDVNLQKMLPTQVKIDINGSGDVSMYATGEIAVGEININGSGDVCTRAVDIKSLTVRINGSGDATVKSTENLDIKIIGSGDVFYTGGNNVNINKMGSGSAQQCNGN
jgi:hypothetical protein